MGYIILQWDIRRFEMKRKEVNGYVDGKQVTKNLVALALKENKSLNEVKREMKEHFPEIVFKVEAEGGI